MKARMHRFILHNDEIHEASEKLLSAGQVGLLSGWGVFTTIEVILLNERDEVAECTSANIFAAKGGEVWTPPLASGCLPGITRELLLSEVTAPGVRVSERVLTARDLESADEVFISSTTRDLLP